MTWFTADKEGLAKILARRGKEFILFEALSNAWDTNATKVEVSLRPTERRGIAELSITDDNPNGFADLTHAYTLFAESNRKSDPTKRGRFNLGEKLVLACFEAAEVRSTTGTEIFDADGRRHSRKRRDVGTELWGLVRLTRPEIESVLAAAKNLIPPIPTIINGEQLIARSAIHEFTVSLPTEIADEQGYLRRTVRQSQVRLYERNGTSRLYELGVPVVETDDPYDCEVMQKVPLNADRDNVTPAYLRELRTKILNEMHAHLPADKAALPAVLDALPNATPEAVNSILTYQYGEKRAIYDPSDAESNRVLQSQGYSLISGHAFTKEAWQNIKAAGAAKPAGQIAPTYQPYSDSGAPAEYLPVELQSPAMRNIANYAEMLGRRLLRRGVRVLFEKGRLIAPFSANYGSGALTFNVDRLGKKWFEQGRKSITINTLLIHELAHEKGGHLTEEFDDAMAELGAKLTALALTEPLLFKDEA